ncbi:MAG: DNA recombination protein RmuC [Ruminococcus sp.]|jgi:DNA recombination protein RmuC|nr:DNA recombination protein RmuC [Ruminococcus sp.]
MDILLTILAIITIGLLLIAIMMLMKIAKNKGNGRKQIAEVQKKVEILGKTAENQNRLMLEQLVRMNESLVYQVNNLGSELRRSNEAQQSKSVEVLEKIEAEMKALDRDNREGLEKLMTANFDSMEKLRRENSESLDKINNTVSEKLQKTLNDRISQSFESVNKRLTEVYAGLGEMKAVASGVSDLKKVLSNVKTRGIMGEIQLGAILAEILAPEQYEEQAAIIPDSSERVDFAVKLPGKENDSVYLPIDSKFPGDTYAKIAAAYESGNAVELKSARSALELEMKRCARSIRTKYVKPPYTTDFAIMFLPFEGLYAEVVNMGLVETLQRDFRINIAGPSTMAAMLNSLQMGFRTLAIQKKSGEVWKILEEAKSEFANFENVLESARNRLRMADKDLETLIGTRTNAINRTLKNVGIEYKNSDE